MSESQWASLVLSDIGAPVTQHNIRDMERWMTGENPPSDWWNRNNPLNASLGTNSSDGLGSYSSLGVGAMETARMIEQNNMEGIDAALRADAPTSQFSAAVVESPWANSHYGGNPNYFTNINPQAGSPGGRAGTMPSKGKYARHQQAKNNVTAQGNTMQSDIFNSLQKQLPLPGGNLDPGNWPLTAVDWATAQIIPLLIAGVFVLIALIVIWHLVAKEMGGVPGPGKALKDAMKSAAMGVAVA